jgi:NAD(P)-dependent dehydrogenase (short-subunit alcohol dehydrogenase family)
MPIKELRGKVAVITGAASGLGLAMAERFGTEGMRLLLADIDDERLNAVGQRLDATGVEVQTLRTDVSKESQIAALADLAYERFGEVHLLCNNAGVAVVGTVWERSLADWAWAIGVNLWSVVHGVRAFVPRMLEQGVEGHIVNTASIAGLLCPPLSGPYVATKHAVVGLSECLFHDLRLRRSKLSVSVLCPGFVKTGIGQSDRARPGDLKDPVPTDDALAREVKDFYENAVEHGADPAEIVQAVVEAVVEDRFYVLTHAELDRALKKRFDGILDRKNPATRALAEMA